MSYFFYNITHYNENRKMVDCSISVSNGNPIPLERNTFKRLDFYQFKKYSICLKLIFILLSI